MVRTKTADRPGPVTLDLSVPSGSVEVVAEAGRQVAEVTLRPLGSGAGSEVVERAVLRWVEATGTLAVEVPEPPPVSAGGFGFSGGGVRVSQHVSHVAAGSSVVGVVLGNGGRQVIVGGGGVTVVNGTTVIDGGGVEVVARVPLGCRVVARSQAAGVSAVGEFAAVEVETVSGPVAVGGAGSLRVETVSGSVRADAVDGRAEVRTTSGAIRLVHVGDVFAKTVSGGIALPAFGGTANASTVSGDITVHAVEAGTVTARSVSGSVRVTAEPAALAEGLTLNARSQFGNTSLPTAARGA